MNISILGTGYVGLVTGACLAHLGHHVTCVDIDKGKISALEQGVVPIFEPGLQEVIEQTRSEGRLRFTDSYPDSIPGSDVVFIAVGTPSTDSGEADLSAVHDSVERMAPLLASGSTVVMKSTVPVGTTNLVASTIASLAPNIDVSVGSNPEFLKQGAAVSDFLQPDRIVFGASDDQARRVLRDIYAPLLESGVPHVMTNIATAELIKYASNAFLAVKLSFINEMADLCEQTGASITDVAIGMGLDVRISNSFLRPGPGYGGSCFPKDTQALLRTSHLHGASSRIVASAVDVNRNRRAQMANRIITILGGDVSGKRIAALGLTFKANTDDLRESPAIDIIRGLVGRGAAVAAFDPEGMDNARAILSGVEFCDGPYTAAEGADAIVILTEWPEFATLDLEGIKAALAKPVMIDLRNLYAPDVVSGAGLDYHSVGRAAAPA